MCSFPRLQIEKLKTFQPDQLSKLLIAILLPPLLQRQFSHRPLHSGGDCVQQETKESEVLTGWGLQIHVFWIEMRIFSSTPPLWGRLFTQETEESEYLAPFWKLGPGRYGISCSLDSTCIESLLGLFDTKTIERLENIYSLYNYIKQFLISLF